MFLVHVWACIFEELKSTFNTKKIRLKKEKKKKKPLVKKIKSIFNSPKSLKITKTHFYHKLKNKAFVKNHFLT
jgi:hypothetical protein